MPTISVNRNELYKLLGETYSQEKFEELCFEFGIELDEVTTEKAMKDKETGVEVDLNEVNPDEIIYRIDVPANRYDILCIEGLTRALLVFLGKIKPPVYKAVDAPEGQVQHLYVKPETSSIRPFVVAAVLRDITFTEQSYQSFIDLQEKLHQNVCRKRTLVAIGTHDLDTLEGPFTYEALRPEDIKFKPLNQATEMTGPELMEHYSKDLNIRKYLHIIKDSSVYPVIYDSKRRVLSLPPIINGDHSKIKLTTKNVFIECTATDLTKAKIVLNTMLTMFAQYCSTPHVVEKVLVHEPSSASAVAYPDYTYFDISADITYINKAVGINIAGAEMATLLDRMSLIAELSGDGKSINVKIPPTRSDILHAADVMEDVAVAYGFNNIKHTFPKTTTVGSQLPINKLSDLLRREVALAGFTEVLTFALCSLDENFKWINKVDDGKTAVIIANPKTAEFQVARTTLLSGLLKTLSNNKQVVLPIKLYEISDVVLKDDKTDVFARNERRLAAIFYGLTSGFEVIHGLLDRVMQMLGVKAGTGPGAYSIRPSQDATYFPDRCADILYDGKVIGVMGIIHPEVFKHFDLTLPCSALEINLEPFL